MTIVAPTEETAVPAGTLRVQGTVYARGTAVRVFVNGVRAVVQGGIFSARIRVTPATMILSAVATTARGVTAGHQIGITVSDPAEHALRLRPLPLYGMATVERHVPLVSAAVPASGKVRADSRGDEDAAASNQYGFRFTFARAGGHSPPIYVPAAAGTADTAAVAHAPVVVDAHRSEREPSPTDKSRQADIERARGVFVMYAAAGSRSEPRALKQRDSWAPVTSGIQPLNLKRGREGDVEQNPTGTRLGSEYSVGVLLIFGTDGFWRVRLF